MIALECWFNSWHSSTEVGLFVKTPSIRRRIMHRGSPHITDVLAFKRASTNLVHDTGVVLPGSIDELRALGVTYPNYDVTVALPLDFKYILILSSMLE